MNKEKRSSSSLRSMPYALSKKEIPLLTITFLSFLGFLNAVYLTILGITRQIPPCSATHGCETVLTSQFAYIGPIPIAALGVGYFVIVMVLTILLMQKKQYMLLRILFGLASLAFLAGLGLIYIQAFILKAFCQYCLLAELLITLIFVMASWIYLKMKKSI